MSTVSSLLTSTLAGMSGNVAKAYIEITDRRKSSVSVQASVPAGGGSSLQSVVSKGLDAASSTVTAAASAAGLGLGTKKTFVVKFNPSSLHLSGFGGGRVTKTNFADKSGEVGMAQDVLRIGMDVKLLFDKTDPADAFMADKLNTSVTAIATNAAKAALSLAGKSNYSVQPEVEAFTAALHNEETRQIAFCWGKMRYEGILERMNARYTMFNTLGYPTRAEITLYLVCVDDEVAKGNMGIWAQYYQKAFGGGSSSLVTASQKTTSLLNFKL